MNFLRVVGIFSPRASRLAHRRLGNRRRHRADFDGSVAYVARVFGRRQPLPEAGPPRREPISAGLDFLSRDSRTIPGLHGFGPPELLNADLDSLNSKPQSWTMARVAAAFRWFVFSLIVLVPPWLVFGWVRDSMLALVRGAYLGELAATMVAAWCAGAVLLGLAGVVWRSQ